MRNRTKRLTKEEGAKAKAGRALLWAGSVVLMGEAAFFLMQLSALWQASGAATLGCVAALGTMVQKMVAFLAWHDGLLLATAAKVLVLCCPLLAIAVGMRMLRKAQYAEGPNAASRTAEEERR